MRFTVSGTDRETGHPIEITLEAVDLPSAALLADRKGIAVTGVRLAEGAVPPLTEASWTHFTDTEPPIENNIKASTPAYETRFWLGLFLGISCFIAPLFPFFGFVVGATLAAIILLYLNFVPLQPRLSNFLRVSFERPVRRVLKLTAFGMIAATLMTFSVLGYLGQRAENEQAADEAILAQANAAADLKASGLVEKAKAALIAGDIDKAWQALEAASKLSSAKNRALILHFETTIKNSTDPVSALNALVGLSDADFDSFKAGGKVPASFDRGYKVLTDSFIAVAKSQLGTAMDMRVEIKKEVAKKNAILTANDLSRIGQIPPTDIKTLASIYQELSALNPENIDYAAKATEYAAEWKEQENARIAQERNDAIAHNITEARQSEIEKQFSSWDGSHIELEKIIKSSMNNPDSFVHVQTVYSDMGDYILVKTTFRGTNAFGGVVTNWIRAKFTLNGDLIEIVDQGP
jgi:hypothetical protein